MRKEGNHKHSLMWVGGAGPLPIIICILADVRFFVNSTRVPIFAQVNELTFTLNLTIIRETIGYGLASSG